VQGDNCFGCWGTSSGVLGQTYTFNTTYSNWDDNTPQCAAPTAAGVTGPTNFRPNMVIGGQIAACNSPRIEVVATVNSNPNLTVNTVPGGVGPYLFAPTITSFTPIQATASSTTPGTTITHNTVFPAAPGIYGDAFATQAYNGTDNVNATTMHWAPLSNTTYTVTATAPNGCTVTATRVINVDISGIPNFACDAVNIPNYIDNLVWTSYNNAGSPGGSIPIPGGFAKELWFKTTVPATGEIHVITDKTNQANTLPGTQVALFIDNPDCNNLQNLDFNFNGGTSDYSYCSAVATPGSIVYIRVGANASLTPIAGTFRMAVAGSLIWTGGNSNNFNDAGNWMNGETGGTTLPNLNRTISMNSSAPNVPAAMPANASIRGARFTPGSITTPMIELNSFDLNVGRNIDVFGAGTVRFGCNGNVNMNAAVAQTVNGRVAFGNLIVTNNSGVTLNSPTTVNCVLHTVSGTLNTNNNLTLSSSSTVTAVVNPGTGTGAVAGNVNVERRLTTNFASTTHLSAPVSGAVMNSSITGYRDDYAFTSTATIQNYGPGVPGYFYNPTPIGFTATTIFPRIWEWVENHYAVGDGAGLLTVPQGTTGVTSYITGWKSAVQNSLIPGKGYSHTNIPNNIMTDTYGPLNNGGITIPASYTVAPVTPWDATQGWNLIGNPYASALNWEAMRGSPLNNGLTTTYYIYKSSGTNAGNYGTYTVGGAQTNTTTANIPSSHGFIVITNGAPTTVNFQNSFRTFNPNTSGNNFAADQTANSLRLEVRGGVGADETLIRFGSFETEFNGLEDAHKLMAYAPGVPSVYTIAGTQRSALNSLPQLTQDYIIPLGVYAQVAGTYELEMTEMVDINPTVMIYLEDLATGTLQNIRENAIYTADIATTGNIDDRFRLIVRPAVSLNGIAATCNGNDGKVEVTYPSASAVNIDLKNTLGAVVASAQNVNGVYTFTNLAAGNYAADVTHNGGFVTTDYVSVPAGNGVAATLVASTNTVNLESNLPVTFTATAQNATSFNWNFGDGTVINNGPANVSHTYAAAGNYIVTFTANNAECSAVASAEVSVVSPTGIFDANYEGVRIFGVRNRVNVQFNNLDDKQGRIEIMNLLGQNIRTVEVNTTKGTREIEVPGIAVGQYLVRVTANDKVYTQKVYLTK
jgi:hypothetical protein